MTRTRGGIARFLLLCGASVAACERWDGSDVAAGTLAASQAENAENGRDPADIVVIVGEIVEMNLAVEAPAAAIVDLTIDGRAYGTCDTSGGPDECRRGDLVRTTAVFDDVGRHTLTALERGQTAAATATLVIDVLAPDDVHAPVDVTPDGGLDAGADGGAHADRGFVDPDRPRHNVFGGVFWSVRDQRVEVTQPPVGSVNAIAACMATYGASIVRHADGHRVSRASVIATAITESNCTNPPGSSNGLSSGPMQVTGRTCAALSPGLSATQCKAKMHGDPDFSFQVGAKYIAQQLRHHQHDPPKIAASYNAGAVRRSTRNRWHMLVTGNHLERWVAAYNAYREWELAAGITSSGDGGDVNDEIFANDASRRIFRGAYVSSMDVLPSPGAEGEIYFVGDWPTRDGFFVEWRDGRWVQS